MHTIASPFSSLSVVIRGLRGSVGAWGGFGWLSLPLAWLLHRRLGRIAQEMEGLASRFVAGRVWRRIVRGGGAPADRTVVRRVVEARIWPRRFGWLVRAAGWQAAGYGSQLRAVLETQEMVALLETVPQAARVLLPLCRMLAVETSLLRPGGVVVVREAVEKPKRVRTPRVKPDLGRVPIPRGIMAAVRRGRYAGA
jgi:hypothetical protein